MTHPHRPRATLREGASPAAIVLGWLVLAALTAMPGAGPAMAQSTVGEPADLQFAVRDATTGQPAAPERLTLDYLFGRSNNVLDLKPEAAAFTAQGVPVKDSGQYIVTVWYQGVPYWWQKRGADLLAGPVTLDVFSVTDNRDAVSITGLNVVARHRQTTVELEIMVEIANLTRPQATVNRGSGTFELQVPAGATNLEASYQRGPEPTPVVVDLSGTRALLAAPLTPGTSRVRLTALVPFNGKLELPVGSDLPIEAWSLLTGPPSVMVEATELQAPDETSVPGFVRRSGPALAPGRYISVILSTGTVAGEPEPLFTSPAPATAPDAGAPAAPAKNAAGGSKFPVPLAALGALIIILAVVLVRRRRS